MTDLTDRMRTCAAYILACQEEAGDPWQTWEVAKDAADLLIEASKEIDVLTGPIDLGEAMEVIPPMQQAARLQQPITANMPPGTWTAPGDTLPVANPYRSEHTCPRCDSRAAKRVRRAGKEMVFVCPACGLVTKKPPAEGTAGGKE